MQFLLFLLYTVMAGCLYVWVLHTIIIIFGTFFISQSHGRSIHFVEIRGGRCASYARVRECARNSIQQKQRIKAHS